MKIYLSPYIERKNEYGLVCCRLALGYEEPFISIYYRRQSYQAQLHCRGFFHYIQEYTSIEGAKTAIWEDAVHLNELSLGMWLEEIKIVELSMEKFKKLNILA